MLQYHSAICEILGIPPVNSHQRLAVLAESEHSSCTSFPAAVIEWFAIPDIEIWFHRHTNQDNLVNIQELGGNWQEYEQGWLRVAWENQGVVHWFCKLNGGDDPSVWNDADNYSYVPFSEIPWVRSAYRFSEFIFDFLARYHYKSWEKGLYISTTSPSVSDVTFSALQSHFRQGPFTEQEQLKVYRFYNEQALINLSWGESSEEVGWNIHPFSQDALREALSLLKPNRTWLENWQVEGWKDWSKELNDYHPTLAGQRVLDEYRASREILDN